MRSANEPTISAVVMPAAWTEHDEQQLGQAHPDSLLVVMPLRNAFCVNEPKKLLPSVNAA